MDWYDYQISIIYWKVSKINEYFGSVLQCYVTQLLERL